MLTAALLWFALSDAPIPFTVVLDAGHGGTNLGTQETGVYEKQVTLEIARRVQRRLAGDRHIRVVLCRDEDRFLPVRTRVRCANQAGARLFVSIHANASPAGASRGLQRGFEIYVQPEPEVAEDAALAALAEADAAAGAWADHRTRATAQESLAAARRIAWQMADALGADKDRGIKQHGAALDVLQGLKMPGVLVEVGFLDHPEEGPWVASAAGCETIAGALARGINDIRARETRGQTDPYITAPETPGPRP